jgi:peptidoglycan/LPS O-acetylase OafA/YrhL
MTYRREVDGLRAVAVLPVVLFHARIEAFRGGFVGVDVFFVISGYLITSIIISEIQEGTFSLVRFYERRARRILPPLFLMMAVSCPLVWLWLTPSDLILFSSSLAAVAAFGSNFLFWKESGYFDRAAYWKPLLHTWSLSVEEQFYLFFPLFLLLTWRLGKKGIGVALLVVGSCSLALAQWEVIREPAAAFFLLPTRAWELMLGGLVALYHNGKTLDGARRRLVCSAGSLLGLAMIGYSVLRFDESVPFPGFYALVPTLGAAFVLLCAFPNTVAGPLLGNRLLVGLGLMSYSTYLWHYPLFVFARHESVGAPSALDYGALFLLALALAYISWRFIEQPFRNPKRTGRLVVLIMAIVGSGGFLALGFTGYRSRGFEAERMTPAQQIVDAAAARNPRLEECHDLYIREPQYMCTYNSPEATWATFGDSHVIELSYALAEVLKPHHIGLQQFSLSGNPVFTKEEGHFETEIMWYKRVVQYINATPTLHTIVVSYRIHSHLFGEHYGVYPGLPDNGCEACRERLWQTLVLILREFVQAGKRVIFVLQAPEVGRPVGELIFRDRESPENIDGVTREWWNKRSAFVRERLWELPKEVIVVDPADLFCDQRNCAAVRAGQPLYFDDNHMSLYGAGLVARQILKQSGG